MKANTHPYRNAFGHAPEAFQATVAQALREARTEPPAIHRHTLRIALVAGLMILLLAGAAYAVATHFGLLEMYHQYHDDTLTEQGRGILSQERAPLAEKTFGEISATVREAIYDGRCLYMSVSFSTQDPGILLLGMDEGGAPSLDATQTLRVNFSASSGDWITSWCDYRREDDGSLVYITGGDFPLEGDALSLQCQVTTSEAFASAGREDSRKQDVFAMTVPVTADTETLTRTVKEPLDAAGITLDTVTMIRTPLAVYYEATYTLLPAATERQRETARLGLWAQPLDAQGEPLPGGMSLGGSAASEDGVHYTCSGSLALEEIPDTVTLEFYSGHSKEIFGRLSVALR